MRFIDYLIYLLLFLLPWQTRLILRPGNGWEYATLGVFGTELLIWLVALSCAVKAIKNKEQGTKNKIIWLFALCSLLFALLNILFVASDRLVAAQQFIHLFEAGILFWILASGQINRLGVIYAFLGGLSLQAILAIEQFLSQSTFASRILGLTLHDAAVGGTSVVENLGGRWLRAYGGLPHPNILGGYMALGIILIVLVFQRSSAGRWQKYLLWLIGALLSTALFFTFSRGAIIALVVALFALVHQAIKNRQTPVLKFISLIFLVLILNSLFFIPVLKGRLTAEGRLESQAISERLGGYGEAWALFKKHPLLGVGAGNYTAAVYKELDSARQSWAYQPVHNSFILVLVELGLLGGGLVVFILNRAYKRTKNKEQGARQFDSLLFALCSLLFIVGLFDHYLWSLYSGLMLVAVDFGLTTRLISDKKE